MLFMVLSFLLVFNQVLSFERSRYRLGLATWLLVLAFCFAFNSSLFSLFFIETQSLALCLIVSNFLCMMFYGHQILNRKSLVVLGIIGLYVTLAYSPHIAIVFLGVVLLFMPNKLSLRLGFLAWLLVYSYYIMSNVYLIEINILTQIVLIVQLARLKRPKRRHHKIEALEDVDFQSHYLSQYHQSSRESILELKSFYQSLLEEPEANLSALQTRLIRYTDEALLNALINYAKDQCDHLGIKLDLSIEVGTLQGIQDEDLSSLFLNMLNNAIEASERVSDKPFIKIELWLDGTYLHVKVSNKTEGVPSFGLKTTKLDVIRHGHGMRIIRELVSQYQGLINIDHKDNVFAIHVALQFSDLI